MFTHDPYYNGSRQPVPLLGTIDYTVQPGDTLYRIARYYNTTIDIIRMFNCISDPNYLFIGQPLLIPESPAEAIIYTVRPGDTLYSIARKYGTYVKNLIDFNYLARPYIIYPGQQLVVTASLR